MPGATITLLIALLAGLIAGSFLNVCIVRIPRGLSIVSPRSHCPGCGVQLRNRDNVPVLSFALLRGRCRVCRERISPQYPLVELATGLWFLVAALPLWSLLRHDAPAELLPGAAVQSAALATLGFLLLGLAVMDWQTYLLPNEFTLGGLALGVLFAFAQSFFVAPVPYKTVFTPEEVFLAERFGAALAGFGLLWGVGALYRLLRRRRGMGGGDAKLAAMLGMFLGPGALGVALFTSLVVAAGVSLAIVVTRRGDGSTKLPFGTFLCMGGLFAACWGDGVAHWYAQLFA